MTTKDDTETSPELSVMDELLEQSDSDVPNEGDVITGKVTSVSRNEVIVDLGTFGTGVVRGKEWFDIMDMYVDMEPGDEVEASITDLENENGQVDLSLKRAGMEKAWDEIKRLKESDEAVDVFVQEANKGGLIANIRGVQAFLPVSQLNSEHYPRVEGGDKNLILDKLKRLANKEITVKVLDYDVEEEKLIISEKEAEAEQKEKALKSFKIGNTIEGTVTGVVDFGAFVKFGDKEDLEGLVHISELAWKRIDHPRDILKVGEKIKVKIIAIDGARISLSLKALQDDPWLKSAKQYEVGQIVEGEVTKVTPFGAFVQLDRDIHGLAHVSELSGEDKNPEDILNAGEKHKFKILSIEPEEHRLGLSLETDGKGKKEEKEKKGKGKEGKKKKSKADKKKEADVRTGIDLSLEEKKDEKPAKVKSRSKEKKSKKDKAKKEEDNTKTKKPKKAKGVRAGLGLSKGKDKPADKKIAAKSK